MSSVATEAQYNLLYYCYAPLGVEGRERVAAALSQSQPEAAAPDGPDGVAAAAAAAAPFGRAMGRSASPPLPLSGRARVGLDGLNASLTGARGALEAHAALVSSLSDFAGLAPIDFKYAPVLASRASTDAAFPRALFAGFSVIRVAEIVTLNAPGADAARGGRHAAPADFHALITAPRARTVLIDVRNAYESDIGAFAPPPGAPVELLRPAVRRFEEMPAWVEAHADALRAAPTIAMYCTGGVRCERFSALVRARFPAADVVQLAGGVQRYMEAAEAGALRDASRWRGKLFVFDDRPPVAVATDAAANPHLPGVMGACVRCAAPWDTYAWQRCAGCGVLVLLCDACIQQADATLADATPGAPPPPPPPPPLACRACATHGPPRKAEKKQTSRRKKREPRPDLAAAAAEKRQLKLLQPQAPLEETDTYFLWDDDNDQIM